MRKRINKILWHGDELLEEKAKAPGIATSADGLDGLNEGEIYISNNEKDPALFIRTSSGKVVRVGVNYEELKKLFLSRTDDDTAEGLINFEKGVRIKNLILKVENDVLSLTNIENGKRAHFAASGTVSSLGVGSTGGGGGSSEGGASALYQLLDVLSDGTKVEGAEDGSVLTYDENAGKWKATKIDIPEADLTEIEGQLTSIDQLITALQGKDTEHSNAITALQTADVQHGKDIAANAASITTLQTDLKSTSDALATLEGAHNELADTVSDFLTEVHVDDTINRWKELEKFLEGYTETATLADLLKGKVDTEVYNTTIGGINETLGIHTTAINSNAANITSINTTLLNHNTRITDNANAITEIEKTLADWFTLEDGVLHSKYGLASDKTVSSLGVGSSEGGGVSYDRLDSWDSYTADKAGYVLSAALGWDLKTRLDNLDLGDFDLSGYLTKEEASKTYATTGDLNTVNDKFVDYLSLKGGKMSGHITLPNKVYIRTESNSYAILGMDGSKYVVAAPNKPTTIRSNGTLKHNNYDIWDSSNFKPSEYQKLITDSNKLAYSLLDGAPTALKNPYALTFGSKSYDGSEEKTITAEDLGAVTNDSLSNWEGTAKITTLGTITTGTWNATKIDNDYIENSYITIAGNKVNLGETLSVDTLQTSLDIVTRSTDQEITGKKTFTKRAIFKDGIQIGNSEVYIYWDSTNKVLRTNVSFASEKTVSSLGVGSESGGGGGSADWGAVPTSIIPVVNGEFNLGTAANRWNVLYANGMNITDSVVFTTNSSVIAHGTFKAASIDGNLMPSIDGEYNIGSPTMGWDEIYANGVNASAITEAGLRVATKKWVEDNFVKYATLNSYTTKADLIPINNSIINLQQSTFTGAENENYYRLTWFTSSGGNRNVDIPTYQGKGFTNIEDLDGVFMADYKMVYDILDYVDNAISQSGGSVNLSNYYTKEQVNSYVSQEINTFSEEKLGTAASKGVTTSVTNGGNDLITSGGVYTKLSNYVLVDTFVELDNEVGAMASTVSAHEGKWYNLTTSTGLASGYIKQLKADTLDLGGSVVATTDDLAGYLPLRGGTITINSYQGITIKRDASNDGGLLWFANNGGNLGAIGFTTNKDFYIDTGSTEHTIIHSGNIGSQSVSYATNAGDADTLDGVQLNDVAKHIFGTGTYKRLPSGSDLNSIDFGVWGTLDYASYTNAPQTDFGLIQVGLNTDYRGQLLLGYGSKPSIRYRATYWYDGVKWSDWRTLAFTDSNVASSTRTRYIETKYMGSDGWYGDLYRAYIEWETHTVAKLKVDGYSTKVDYCNALSTARTIWGQSFDGSGDVSGYITTHDSLVIDAADYYNSGWARGIVFKENGYDVAGLFASGWHNHVDYINLVTSGGYDSTNGLRILSNGNVLIGTTTDSGTKLNVHGSVLVNRYAASGYKAGADIVINKSGDWFGIGASASNVGNISIGTTSDAKGTWKSEIATITDSGNISIGTTNANGYKLYVNGDSYVNGELVAPYPFFGYSGSCDVWFLKEGGYSRLNAASSLAFTVGYDANNIALAIETDKSATFYGSLTVSGGIKMSYNDGDSTALYTEGMNTILGYIPRVGNSTTKIVGTKVLVDSNLEVSGSLSISGSTMATQSWVNSSSTPATLLGNLVNQNTGLTAGYINEFKADTINGGTPIHGGNIDSIISEHIADADVYSAAYLRPVMGTYSPSSWNPKTSYKRVWGESFSHGDISSDTGDILYYLRASEYGGGTTELCVVIDGDYYAGTGQYKVIHEGNIGYYAISKNGGAVTGTLSIGSTRLNVGSTTLHGDVSLEYGALTLTHGNIGSSYWSITNDGAATVRTLSQTSDITKKNVLSDIRLSLGEMANAPLIKFTWVDGLDSKLHVGTIAQYWDACLPEVVSTTTNGTLALSYGELGVAMGISLATHLTETNDEVSKLKKRVEELENENKRLQERVDALVA